MSRQFTVRALLAAAGLMGASAAGATESITIDAAALDAAGCFGLATCVVDGASLRTYGGPLAKKSMNGVTGFGVAGRAAGAEIDIGELLRVDLTQPRSVIAIKVLFLYNGPEFGDKAERASIIADGTAYTLSVRNDADDAAADWSGPGTVTKCGATTASGTGCFIVTDPFPGAVSRIEFKAVAGGKPYGKRGGSSESDYSVGFIDVAAERILELQDCVGATGCAVSTVGGSVGFSLNSMQSSNPSGGGTEALVIPVQFPDCRYVPRACLDLLPPAGDTPASDDAARARLIGLGVIRSLDSGGDKLKPATQLLNVTPLLPAEVTSLFDASGKPPGGLPPMYIGPRWRGQSANAFRIDGYFFRTDTGVVFTDAFGGLVDVSVLTGDELGCFTDPGNLLAWDVITTVSELAKSVGGRYVDTPINVGCENPTKVRGSRLSLYSVNLEVAPDTYGPTIKSRKATVTTDNDAVFARLVQSLWKDVGEVRSQYACKPGDPAPAGSGPPLSSALCKKLSSAWSVADYKVNLCVDAAFQHASSYRSSVCRLAAKYVADFAALLPATASGPDTYNRLGELKARVEVFQHVWTERYLNSLTPKGFCREKGSCRR